MKRSNTLLLILLFVISSVDAQIRLEGYNQKLINPVLLKGHWSAQWIAPAQEPANAFGIYHFRKNIELKEAPASFVIHVSADNRYKLYVNGRLVSLGPARGDIYNWNFETVDIAPFLQAGRNTLAAVVWNFAEQKPVAQISYDQTGFLLQGNTEAEEVCNTNNTWVYLRNDAYASYRDWQVLGYYVAGPGELLTSSAYPWGWEQSDYDDSRWNKVATGMQAAIKGSRDYPGRLLVPSPIPPMEMKTERFAAIRQVDGISKPDGFPAQQKSVTIPANTQARLLLDHQQLTTGYLSLLYSQGKGAEITISYAEALYESQENATTKSYTLNTKGNRNDTEGKQLIGYADKIVGDGGQNRLFTTLWWRTWRFVELQIATADEPLVLDDIYGTFSAYPFEQAAEFQAKGHEELNKMLDIGWHTARLCANETYMDCPYYEQLQYFGDTRIQAMVSLYNTRDRYMVKNAIEQGRQSIVADGITMSRYPSALHQFISSFSLWWICMTHDYWMHRGDDEYVKSLLPAIRGVLAWYEQWLKPDHSLGYVPHWFFVDWAAGLDYGEPIREKDGNSALQDLLYLLALETMVSMEEEIGISNMASHYRGIADKIRESFRGKYWDANRKLFADTHDHRSYSQHVNSLAIIAGMVEDETVAEVMQNTLQDKSLIQATIYFRYYVHQALSKAGLGDQLIDNLQIWRDQMSLGLTTWAEMPEPSRSDCHAWGASPNIEFYRILLGIRSEAPGFKRIRVAPAPGDLKEVSGKMPHPNGDISVSYKLNGQGQIEADISLPPGTEGVFEWKGKELPLKSGKQIIRL